MDCGTGFETKFGNATKWNFENRRPRSKKVLATNNNDTKLLRQNYAADSRTQSGTPHFANCMQQATEGVATAATRAVAVRPRNMSQPNIQLVAGVAQSAQRLATGGTVRGSNPGGKSRFSASVQTGPGAHPASCTMGTESFPGVKRPGRGVDHPPHLALRLKKE